MKGKDGISRRWFRRAFRAGVRVAPEFIRRGVVRLPFSRFNRLTSAVLWGEERIEWEGLQILVNPGEMIGFYTYLFDDSARVEMDYLIGVCRDARVVFDIGANRAWMSLALAKHCPQARVVGFEPDPDILRMAHENLALNAEIAHRITLQGCALGDQNGTLSFARSDGQNLGTGRLYERTTESSITVQCRTVDTVCSELGVYPDVVKIDVEGAELAVLRGMANLLRDHPPSAMLVELHGFYLADSRDFYRDIHALLTAAGYDLLQMKEHGFEPAEPWSQWSSRLHLGAVRPGPHYERLSSVSSP
jgi:FkbM family methyltransferase